MWFSIHTAGQIDKTGFDLRKRAASFDASESQLEGGLQGRPRVAIALVSEEIFASTIYATPVQHCS